MIVWDNLIYILRVQDIDWYIVPRLNLFLQFTILLQKCIRGNVSQVK